MVRCSVRFCRRNSSHDQGTSFFRFPLEKSRCIEWLNAMGRQEGQWIDSEKLHQSMFRVCSDHFHPNSFSSMLMNRLKKDASPSIFRNSTQDGCFFDRDLSQFLENGIVAPESTEKNAAEEKNDESKNDTIDNGICEDQSENSTEKKEGEQEGTKKVNEKEPVESNENGTEKGTESSSEVPNENGLSETVDNETVDKEVENENKDNHSETGTQNEDNDDDDYDINPLLLCPDISMDVDESPVVTTSSGTGADSGSNDLLDSNSLFEPRFSAYVDEMTGAEISFNLTAEEQQLREQMYGPNNPIEFSKVHCSACNVHLGSALAGQTNRFVHPLLKVLICKECYHFYMSGEFEKDEDGSELYCRWCGQGGQVLCCTKCEFVFCKKCIRINFGRKKLTEVRDSEEWLCFRCDMSQLRTLRAMCAEFFEYVKRETARAATVGDGNYMNRDLTTCCQSQMKKRPGESTEVEKEVKRPKRKKIVEDPDYNPFSDYNETKEKEEDKKEIVAVAGPSGINNTPNKLPQLTPRPVITSKNVITMPGQCPTPTLRIGNTIINVNPSKATPISTSAIRMLNANMRPITTAGAPRPNVVFAKARPTGPRPNFQGTPRFTLVTPGTSKIMNTIRMSPVQQQQPSPTTPKEPSKTQSPMKHEWFEKTVRSAARVNSNLSYTLTQLNKAQANAVSVEQLAVVHNKLQEILSSSINSLIQIRKNLRTEFIAGIKTTKFPPKPKGNQNNNDDDDVVIVSSSTPEISITPKAKSKVTPVNPPKLTPVSAGTVGKKTVALKNGTPKNVTPKIATPTSSTAPSGGYLKVRSFSQLQSVPSECITIPDDDPPKKNVAEVSKDPLEENVEPKEDPVVEDAPVVEVAPVVENTPAVEDVPVDKDAPIVENDKEAVVEPKEKPRKKKRASEKKSKTIEAKTNDNDKEANSVTIEEKTTEGDTEKSTTEETIETRLSNGVPENEKEPVKVKEEPKEKDCNSYIVTEKPSPKIRRMLSVKVNLKKTPIIEDMVKKEPIENGG